MARNKGFNAYICRMKAQTYKILFVSDWYPDRFRLMNGIFVQKHAQAAALHHQVGVLHAAGDPHISQYDLEYSTDSFGVQQWKCYFPKSNWPLVGVFINMLRLLLALRKAYKAYAKTAGQPDIIHGNIFPRGALMAWYISLLAGRKPWIVHEHWTGYQMDLYQQLGFFKQNLIKFLLPRPKMILAVSNALKQALLHINPTLRIEVVANVLTPQQGPLQCPIELETDKTYLFTVGLDDVQKNASGLIRTFLNLAPNHRDLVLLVAGDHADRAAIEASIEHHPLRAQIVFLGTLPNEQILAIMQASAFYICFSNAESFSVTLIEAISLGKPVISTRCGGPESFVTPQNGLLINVGDETALAQAIQTMLGTYHDYPAAEISQEILARYGINAIGQQLDAVYQDLLKYS